LKGGASRNSIKLGDDELYSNIVKMPDTMHTSATICTVSTVVFEIINDGVAIINITRIALKTAPESREITATLPSFRSVTIRCRVLVPF